MTEDYKMTSKNLAHTQITPLVRVSTAMIHYPIQAWGGDYCQFETFIFSDDPRIKSKQTIYGTSHEEDDERLTKISLKGHENIVKKVEKFFNPQE